MELLSSLGRMLGFSFAAGINLYATVAIVGLASRYHWVDLPQQYRVFDNDWIIGLALLLYVVEFVADKIPIVDSTWDVIHTFIRIPAGAVLAAATFGDFDKSVQVIAFLLGGGLALTSHGTKAATRAVINMSPEPVSNIVASTLEDVLAVVSVVFALFYPVLLFLVVAVGLVISALVLPRIVRFFRRVIGSIRRLFAPATS